MPIAPGYNIARPAATVVPANTIAITTTSAAPAYNFEIPTTSVAHGINSTATGNVMDYGQQINFPLEPNLDASLIDPNTLLQDLSRAWQCTQATEQDTETLTCTQAAAARTVPVMDDNAHPLHQRDLLPSCSTENENGSLLVCLPTTATTASQPAVHEAGMQTTHTTPQTTSELTDYGLQIETVGEVVVEAPVSSTAHTELSNGVGSLKPLQEYAATVTGQPNSPGENANFAVTPTDTTTTTTTKVETHSGVGTTDVTTTTNMLCSSEAGDIPPRNRPRKTRLPAKVSSNYATRSRGQPTDK